MKIIIAGAGAVGTHLAKLLSKEHHDITLMDENPEKLEDISSNFDILTLALPPCSISALKEAEVKKRSVTALMYPGDTTAFRFRKDNGTSWKWWSPRSSLK